MDDPAPLANLRAFAGAPAGKDHVPIDPRDATARIQVRPFDSGDLEPMVDYYLGGSPEFLAGMGVDLARLPAREAWLEAARADFARPDPEKRRFYVAWLVDDALAGHSSISHIAFGESAHVHLHVWRPDLRGSGFGTELLARSIDLYFERFRLQRLICEPFAENRGPNRTVERLGFVLEKHYRTIPTEIALEQDVNRWVLERDAWRARRGGAGE